MFINGEQVDLEGEQSMTSFLEARNYLKDRIAVEVNGAILPKKEYDNYMIKQDDKIEIVCFVGGG